MATEVPPSDAECVRAARDGDSTAAGDLMRKHAPGVLTLLSRVLGDREIALDLAQETFLRAYRSLDRFDASRSLRAWLNAIAWNLALDHLRQRRRRGERVGLSFEGPRRFREEAVAEEPLDHREEAPQTLLERREERELVRRALAQLPAAQRAALVLRDLEGFSYEEVARVLRCRLGTVKSRISRARLEFRDIYLRLEPSLREPRS